MSDEYESNFKSALLIKFIIILFFTRRNYYIYQKGSTKLKAYFIYL